MNAKQIVRLSNIIGITSILLLVYWVFTFITIQVFGLKVFKENMTETFYLSILGILALMVGSLIINLMFNLTRIAEKHNLDAVNNKSNRLRFLTLTLIFPLIAIILFGGDYLTSAKKEERLIKSAESIIAINKANSDKLVNYSF
ncbi:peptidase, partial [Flavobacterium oncorhynchi]